MNNLEENIKYISNHHYHCLMKLPNVQGVGLGYKCINNYNTKEPCIHVLVKNKVPLNSLNACYTIPKSYMGIKTDVVNLNGIATQHSLKDKIRPLEAGYSTGASLYKTGTLSCIVYRSELIGRNYFLLSCNHVFAGNNRLPLKSKIIQPAHQDGGRQEQDLVGYLSEFVPLKFQSLIHSYVNYVDAAIAKVTKINLISNKLALIGSLKGVESAKLDEHVRKVGRTTGLTEGTIETINATVTMNVPNLGDLLFKNQIVAKIEQLAGDSGSILVNKDNKVVGLCMGGPSRFIGMFNDFNDVLKYTKTKLYI